MTIDRQFHRLQGDSTNHLNMSSQRCDRNFLSRGDLIKKIDATARSFSSGSRVEVSVFSHGEAEKSIGLITRRLVQMRADLYFSRET